ncbi:MAG: ROK family glucokinase [Firmicutes bacterium]|nr:ROK family glucokinase [Bacillota bacterium]
MYHIGIDLGGTNIAAGLTDENGKIICRHSVPTIRERENDEIVKDMIEICRTLCEKSGADKSKVKSVGIGCPGLPDRENGILLYSCNLNMENMPIAEVMNKELGIPIYIDNDANCAALGENICGATKNCRNSITITLGTGVGGGIILNNRIYSGSFNGGTELGHIVIAADGELCGCGRHGCWEAYASATALIRDARAIAAKYPSSEIYNAVSGNIKLIDAKTAFDAAEKNDEYAVELVNKYYEYVSIGLVNLINIFEPEIIALGGGISEQGDKLIEPVKKLVEENVYGGVLKTKIVKAMLGNDAGIIGAALLSEQGLK